MLRAYGFAVGFGVLLAAEVAATFDMADRNPGHEVPIVLAGFVLAGLVALCLSRGPLRSSFELAGLGRRDRSLGTEPAVFSFLILGVGFSLMQIVLGHQPGFLPRFIWLTVTFVADLAVYGFYRQRARRGSTSIFT